MAACSGGDAGESDGANSNAWGYATGLSSNQRAQPCAAVAASKKPAGLIDFALSKLNHSALFQALDRELSEVRNSKLDMRADPVKVIAVTSMALTAGFVGWLLRGGALLSALLSSMPLWRGLDPLMVVLQPRRKNAESQRHSRVDLMFDNARKFNHYAGDPRA